MFVTCLSINPACKLQIICVAWYCLQSVVPLFGNMFDKPFVYKWLCCIAALGDCRFFQKDPQTLKIAKSMRNVKDSLCGQHSFHYLCTVVFYQVCSVRVSFGLVVKGQLEKPIIFFCLDSQGFNRWPRFYYRNLCIKCPVANRSKINIRNSFHFHDTWSARRSAPSVKKI